MSNLTQVEEDKGADAWYMDGGLAQTKTQIWSSYYTVCGVILGGPKNQK